MVAHNPYQTSLMADFLVSHRRLAERPYLSISPDEAVPIRFVFHRHSEPDEPILVKFRSRRLAPNDHKLVDDTNALAREAEDVQVAFLIKLMRFLESADSASVWQFLQT